MAYCPRCGVEIEDRLDRCPLCDTPIPLEARDDTDSPPDYPEDVILPKSMYRPLTDNQRSRLLKGLLGLLVVFPIAVTIFLDIAITGSITWSFYVVVPIVGAGIVATLFIRYPRRPFIAVTGTLVTLLVIEIVLDAWITGRAIGRSPELPYFIVGIVAVEAFLIFIRRGGRSVRQIIAFILIDASFLVCAVDLLVSRRLSWSLIVVAALLPVVVFVLYLIRVKKRGMNVAGFLFIDAAAMLLLIDLAVDGAFSWSLVTTLVLIPIAVAFYTLHVALFNDTDWRKALHL